MSTFKLDKFQKDGIDALNEYGNNCIVCAPTGTGKTFIAEEAIRKCIACGMTAIYTTPIKCLSNEKCASLSRNLNQEIGLITGDMKHNIHSNVIVMTTEIYSKILSHGEIRDDTLEVVRTIHPSQIGLVVFDEAHYLYHEERGHVWETSIIRTPPQTQMLLLSATIENPEELQRWITKIKDGRECTLIKHSHRPVPLNHMVYRIKCDKKDDKPLLGNGKFMKVMSSDNGKPNIKFLRDYYNSTNAKVAQHKNISLFHKCFSLMQKINMLPAIVFVFSCKACESYANGMHNIFENEVYIAGNKPNPTKTYDNIEAVMKFEKMLSSEVEVVKGEQYRKLREAIAKGVGFHHSGLLPILKEAVEIMFGEGHIKVLFATETFSVGVNYPAKSVVFTSIEKWEGKGYDLLKSFNYHQMAGRAGRRGKDAEGFVVHLTSMYKDCRSDDIIQVMQPPKNSIERYLELTPTIMLETMLSFRTDSVPINIMLGTMQGLYSRSIKFEEIFTEHHDAPNEETNLRVGEILEGIKCDFDRVLDYLMIEKIVKIDGDMMRFTRKGRSVVEFGERTNSIMLVNLIITKAFDKLPLGVMAALVSMFISNEVRSTSRDKSEMETECERMISLFEERRGVITSIKKAQEIAQFHMVYEYDFDYQLDLMCPIRKWIEDEDRSLESVSQEFSLYPGALYKALLRLKNVFLELSACCTHMMEDLLAEKFMKIVRIINDRGLLCGSLYL